MRFDGRCFGDDDGGVAWQLKPFWEIVHSTIIDKNNNIVLFIVAWIVYASTYARTHSFNYSIMCLSLSRWPRIPIQIFIFCILQFGYCCCSFVVNVIGVTLAVKCCSCCCCPLQYVFILIWKNMYFFCFTYSLEFDGLTVLFLFFSVHQFVLFFCGSENGDER